MDVLSARTVNMSLKNNAKILVIYSSPKKEGNTKKLLDAFLAECPNSAQIKTYSAFELNAKPCIDCGFCKQNNSCKFDDLNEFYLDFEQADLIVFATPVYNYSFPSPLKAIFDRFQRYFNARFERDEKPPIKKRRQAVILATCGSDDESGFDIIEYQCKRAFTVLNIELVGKVTAKNIDKNDILVSDIDNSKQLAISIFNK